MTEQVDTSANITTNNNSKTSVLNQSKQEEILAMRQKQIDARKEELVQVICRQTELTEIEAKEQLEDNQYDCMKVLNKYFDIDSKNNTSSVSSSSANQMIYGEIRNLMDTGAKKYRMDQEKKEYLEKIQKFRQQQQQEQKQQQEQTAKEKQDAQEKSTILPSVNE